MLSHHPLKNYEETLGCPPNTPLEKPCWIHPCDQSCYQFNIIRHHNTVWRLPPWEPCENLERTCCVSAAMQWCSVVFRFVQVWWVSHWVHTFKNIIYYDIHIFIQVSIQCSKWPKNSNNMGGHVPSPPRIVTSKIKFPPPPRWGHCSKASMKLLGQLIPILIPGITHYGSTPKILYLIAFPNGKYVCALEKFAS